MYMHTKREKIRYFLFCSCNWLEINELYFLTFTLSKIIVTISKIVVFVLFFPLPLHTENETIVLII